MLVGVAIDGFAGPPEQLICRFIKGGQYILNIFQHCSLSL